MEHGTHEQWREHWEIEENEDVWSPAYGWGEVASAFEGGDYPILVTYRVQDKDGDYHNLGRYYTREGYADGGGAIYPKTYAIALDAAMANTRVYGNMKAQKREEIKTQRDPEIAWVNLSRVMRSTPCGAFFDFSSTDVLTDFMENLSAICIALADTLERRYAAPGSDGDGDGHTDV